MPGLSVYYYSDYVQNAVKLSCLVLSYLVARDKEGKNGRRGERRDFRMQRIFCVRFRDTDLRSSIPRQSEMAVAKQRIIYSLCGGWPMRSKITWETFYWPPFGVKYSEFSDNLILNFPVLAGIS